MPPVIEAWGWGLSWLDVGLAVGFYLISGFGVTVCHMIGERPFAAQGKATNFWPLAILSIGESWHNLHHADPTCARHGVRRGQIDMSANLIRMLAKLGSASQVRWPTPRVSPASRRQKPAADRRQAVVLPNELVESFASLDRARLTRMTEPARERQLIARQILLEYVETLWEDVQRCGERPDIGEKYQALATVLALTRSLSSVAFDAVYDRWSP